jgi:predicted branched-subunit amino acid permease
LLMGLSLSQYLEKEKPLWRYLLAFGMTDESYVTTVSHFQHKPGNAP